MLPLPGTQTLTDGGSLRPAPAALEPQDAPLLCRRRGCLQTPPYTPGPQGEEKLMGTCDFFPQRTQTHPSRTQGRAWGRGPGRKKKLFSAPWRVTKCLPQARVALRPRAEAAERPAPAPLPRRGSFAAATRPADLATWARSRPGLRERKRPGGYAEAGMRPARRRRMPPGRPLGSGGAPAAPGRRRAAQQAVAAAGAAVLTVARGRLNPLLPLQGLGKGVRKVG